MKNKVLYLTFLSLSLISTVAWSSSLSPNTISHGELIRIISGLLFVLFIIIFLSWIVKRMHKVSITASKGLQTIASMVLGPKERVVLLKTGDRYLLVGVSSYSINLLCDFGNQLPEGFDADHKSSFADVLKSAIGKS
ncbi:TPA: flagellar biosynthetic protein FliO [Legionella pneumophila]|uniref:flagellar biosynthetic protein FliO n=1 Tax=Legionella pneumophila TaxID=446 RepID=UPI000786A743|nr:flagellar biosynthetic protein FliO [Legionella pneumophila]MDW8877909.1 flagellar biosynthetic protein FliO [Legionella pneumophila subsp. fraseri]MDW8960948.1 flagellar biosynthetic protein FliO [Legionella pneumophila subsp. fraseri]MDW9035028.1 flagellar biosynthetic protein FliO [Legionella pneumophila subsp. fraseri]MDW9038090.1 flagellar biosynthetic protein FliO [Legionella pneumophila subsp. fraseri]MDW9041150.1 flagellar biosynthetic protein FliO [Legionella pneumophila subsp. fra